MVKGSIDVDCSFDLQHRDIKDTEKAWEPVTVLMVVVVNVTVEVTVPVPGARRDVVMLHRAIGVAGCWM